KIAAIEAMWETEPAPAGLSVFGIPDTENKRTLYEVKIPWVLGLMTTRSFDKEVPGIRDLVQKAENHIREGMKAYDALEILRKDKQNRAAKKLFDAHGKYLGYGLLLKKYRDDIQNATEAEIDNAAQTTIPNIGPLFWSFRIMVGLGLFFIALFSVAFYLSARRRLDTHKLFLRVAMCSLPLPWVAAELGWFVAEHGRQPWTIDGILPTFLSASNVPASHVWISLTGFVVFYSILLVVDLYLMRKYIKLGPVMKAAPKKGVN
ncbi:MAG: cytochrome ubiquinol oxidase subunit I, partial [Alphaproteobacteria bacterium]|nr:cytochrome ubiquinol oxidase subunit I [Alphaproteobacteria bacterium]